MPDDKTKVVKTPAGRYVEAPADSAESGEAFGAREATPAEVTAERKRLADEETYGGILGAAAAGVESFAAGAIPGYDTLGRAMFGDKFVETRRKQKEYQPVVSTLGEVSGAVVGPGKAGAALGKKVAAQAGGGLGAKALGGFIEGGVSTVGSASSEVALSENPLDLERAISTFSSHFLLGGVPGAAVPVAGRAARSLQKSLARGGKAVSEAGAVASKAAAIPDDIARADAAGLRAIEESEKAALQTQRVAEKEAIANEILAHRQEVKAAKPWLATEDKTLRRVSMKADYRLDAMTDNLKGLSKNPERALDALQRNEQVLAKIVDESGAVRAQIAEEVAAAEVKKAAQAATAVAKDRDLAQKLAAQLESGAKNINMDSALTRRFAVFSNDADMLGVAGFQTSPKRAREFLAALESGAIPEGFAKTSAAQEKVLAGKGVLKVTGEARLAALDGAEKALQTNRALQAKLEALATQPTSPRLDAIAAARDALNTVPKQGLFARVADKAGSTAAMGAMSGILPGGPLGAVGAMLAGDVIRGVKGAIVGKMGAATAESAARTAAAVERFMNAGAKAAKVLPPLASKVLSSVSYGPAPEKGKEPAPKKGGGLLESYRAREKELQGQVQIGMTGKLEMRPQARARVAERLAAVRAASPLVADKFETLMAKRVEFLASKLPKRPDYMALQTGPDRWQPSDMAIRQFARYASAVEDPGGVEERLAAGVVTPEDAEAYKTVYPERFEALKRDIMKRLPELQATLKYERQVALSVFTGIPVDPAFQPHIMRRLQGGFAAEPGSEGGSQAPQVQPNFGSLGSARKEEMTPSQQREIA